MNYVIFMKKHFEVLDGSLPFFSIMDAVLFHTDAEFCIDHSFICC